MSGVGERNVLQCWGRGGEEIVVVEEMKGKSIVFYSNDSLCRLGKAKFKCIVWMPANSFARKLHQELLLNSSD